jgi:hypothetical protein
MPLDCSSADPKNFTLAVCDPPQTHRFGERHHQVISPADVEAALIDAA